MKYFHYLLFIGIVFFSCNKKDDLNVVTTSERQILLNNSPYIIKGICYHPVPKGSDKRDFGNLDEDLELMHRSWNQYDKSICSQLTIKMFLIK